MTKSKNDNKYGCRHSLNDAIKRGTDMLLAGKRALVIGYGDVGKGSAQSLRQEGMIVRVAEVDPICAMQACMDGYEVVSPYIDGINTGRTEDIDTRLLGNTDLIVTCTGNSTSATRNMLKALKRGAVVCNIGHFDNEIDTAFMRKNWRWDKVKDQVHQILPQRRPARLPDPAVRRPAREPRQRDGSSVAHHGRLVREPGARADAPVRDSAGPISRQNQRAPITVEVLPKKLDEEVAQLMVEGFGGVVTRLTNDAGRSTSAWTSKARSSTRPTNTETRPLECAPFRPPAPAFRYR